MTNTYCILNGQLIPHDEAKLHVDHIEFAYGFGVYENLKIRKDFVYFVDEHIDRLFHSARVIGLEHTLEKTRIREWIQILIEKNQTQDSNIKIILIGGKTAQDTLLYIFTLAPKFIENKEYRDGVKAITYLFERFLPEAKTLNMLPSYVIFKKAQKQGCFDALLIDHDTNITEGTRSNFFAIKNKTLYTPRVEHVLDGVTRRTVIDCAKKNKYKIIEQNIALKNVFDFDGAFFTNTSGKIVPIRTIDDRSFETITDEIHTLQSLYNNYLDEYAKQHTQ
jgi:branched-subunit amino acid aminotransferase/4-amino-4-deoxychorismate lyase